MRKKVTTATLEALMQGLAKSASSPGSVYFTGGVTALMCGLREQTLDVDLRLDPEPKGIFEGIAKLKNQLDLNIKLASPADFIPAPRDWREHSIFVAQYDPVKFYHFDFRAQALSKIERGHAHDWADARGFLNWARISAEALWKCFLEDIKPGLVRYPALDPERFEMKVRAFLNEYERQPDR